MYTPYLEKYIDSIIDIKRVAEKVAKKLGYKDVEELTTFLFGNSKNSREKRSIKRKIYRPLRNKISRTQYMTIFKEALNQDNYIFTAVTDDELKRLGEWVEVNGKKWKLAEEVFHRPSRIVRSMYHRHLRGTGRRNVNTLDQASSYIYLILKYYPQTVFDIKDINVHAQCVSINRLHNKIERYNSYAFKMYRERFAVYGHRFWSIDAYEHLFNYVLEHSRPCLLDSIPCMISIRYLAYPVNQLFHPIEYIFRLVYLYIYYIYEIPFQMTVREFIQFLQERLVVQKEEIPTLCFLLKGSNFKDIDFCGFIRGCNRGIERYSEEIAEEVKYVLDLERPTDEELKDMIASANANGCQLRLAAEYSRMIPSEIEQSEEMMYEEEWQEVFKNNDLNREYKGTQFLFEDSEEDTEEEEEKQKQKQKQKLQEEEEEKLQEEEEEEEIHLEGEEEETEHLGMKEKRHKEKHHKEKKEKHHKEKKEKHHKEKEKHHKKKKHHKEDNEL